MRYSPQVEIIAFCAKYKHWFTSDTISRKYIFDKMKRVFGIHFYIEMAFYFKERVAYSLAERLTLGLKKRASLPQKKSYRVNQLFELHMYYFNLL